MNNDERQAKNDQNHKLRLQSKPNILYGHPPRTSNNGMDPLSHVDYVMSDNVQCKIVPCILESLVCDF